MAATVKRFPAGVLEAEIQRALAGPDARAGSGECAPGDTKRVTSCKPAWAQQSKDVGRMDTAT